MQSLAMLAHVSDTAAWVPGALWGAAACTGISVGVALAILARSRRRLRHLVAEMRVREAQLSTIITSEPACVKTVSRDLRLQSMNPAGLHAIEAESFAQVDGADLRDLIHPEHLDDFLALNNRVFAGESDSLRFRIIGLRGTERWMETYAAPLRDETGTVVSQLAVTYDVSDRIAMEQRLIDACDAAIAGTRAKSEFLANMSHEIRTPMTAILGWTDVLRERFEADRESVAELDIIERNGHHLLAIIDQILDLSRIEAGKSGVADDSIDPGALVEETRAALLPLTAGRPVELLIEIDDQLPRAVRSDRTRVMQVLINLCNNALKFTESGAVTLRARPEGQGVDRSIVFEVEDTGPGIDPELMQRVYDAFEQADASASRRHGGVGLGLAISRSVADLLGGSLGLSSEVGVGTTARLRLPIRMPASDSAPSTSRADAAEVADATGLRVLVAEDGADNQRLLRHVLDRAGCHLELAGDGREALALEAAARERGQPFDVILMDVQMPVLDGHGAARALRDRGVMTPVIALTAHAMDGDRERAIEAGCDGYLTKPIRPRVLLAEIVRHATPMHGQSV